ncbi:MAG: MlaE family ABC transporter permease, partial [Longimicrobiales bacterium]
MANPIVSPVVGWFAKVGRAYHITLEHAGALDILAWDTIVALVTLKVRFRDVLRQLHIMGVQSLPIVFVTASLAGIVTSQQGGYQLISSSPRYVLGTLVVQSVVLELAPLLTAVVLVGRIGARITAELGTMVVSEQIDAFKSLGRDPVAILAAPRIVAGVLTMPLLVGFANVIGIYAGML